MVCLAGARPNYDQDDVGKPGPADQLILLAEEFSQQHLCLTKSSTQQILFSNFRWTSSKLLNTHLSAVAESGSAERAHLDFKQTCKGGDFQARRTETAALNWTVQVDC